VCIGQAALSVLFQVFLARPVDVAADSFQVLRRSGAADRGDVELLECVEALERVRLDLP
jgi:hypothetical protein